ncbi:MAG: hypothetical protein CL878_11285 [Dehalococcoidia bacterium]|nr:hypothetical protein [Dehalococcoidia bacterium]
MAVASDVRPPRVISEQRRDADRIALGDTATLEDSPALLQHLRERAPGQTFALGTAIHPLTTIPLGLAIDAAILAVNGRALKIAHLRYSSFSMERIIATTRPLRAVARVAELGAHHIECVVEVWEDEHLVCKARIGLCQVRDGRAALLAHLYTFDGDTSQPTA